MNTVFGHVERRQGPCVQTDKIIHGMKYHGNNEMGYVLHVVVVNVVVPHLGFLQ